MLAALAVELTTTTATDSKQAAGRLLQLKNDASTLYDTLPPYEQRRQTDIISSLEASLKQLQASTAPSSSATTGRFAFGRTRKQQQVQQPPPVPNTDSPPIDIRLSTQNVEEDEEVQRPQRRLEYIGLAELDRAGNANGYSESSISLAGLDRCIVDLRSTGMENADNNRPREARSSRSVTIPALYIEKIKQCLVIAPDVTGSVLIHDVEECILILKCHQFRMHTSHNIKVIIETESIPIIEKCKDIKFARYSSTTNKEEIIKLEIQDFDAPNNLSEQVQNWTLLDREEYDGIQAIIGTVNLKDTIEDLTSGNIDETLKKLGI